MRRTAVQVRLVEEGDVAPLERQAELGPPEKHRPRYLSQKRGELAYFVAWGGDRPAGHVVLVWAGTLDQPMASRLAGCPNIEDLLVIPDLRRRGLGSALMEAAEGLAMRYGYRRIGLGVALDNHVARTLYERRGYEDSGFGEYAHDSCVYSEGRYQIRTEICIYLIKELGSAP